jgi:hypothetical protein
MNLFFLLFFRFGDANYGNKEDCDWIIEALPGKNVHLTFRIFEMEDEQECGYDYIEVFSGARFTNVKELFLT